MEYGDRDKEFHKNEVVEYGDRDEELHRLLSDQKRLIGSEPQGVEIKWKQRLWSTLQLGKSEGLVIHIRM